MTQPAQAPGAPRKAGPPPRDTAVCAPAPSSRPPGRSPFAPTDPISLPLRENRITEKLAQPARPPSGKGGGEGTQLAGPRSLQGGRGGPGQPQPIADRPPRADGALPIAQQQTRLLERRPQWSAELVALLGCALRKDTVLDLLEGLAIAQRGTARSLAQHVLALDSGTRKARLSREFGERLDGAILLRGLMASCPGLEADLWRRLPPHHQRSYPRLQAVSGGAPNAVRTLLLERLIKETLR